jgi:hypothetical protein
MADYNDYLLKFKPFEEESNIPRLQIFKCTEDHHDGHPNCCPVMVDSIKSCSYGKPKNGKVAEDVAEFEGDDPYDDLRYACDTAERFYSLATDEWNKVEKQQKFIDMFERNKDFTAFYRNMRTLENQDDMPVRRFHRAPRY